MKTLFKKFKADERGNTQMIGAVVALLITCIIAILVFYNIAASIDSTTVDSSLTGTP